MHSKTAAAKFHAGNFTNICRMTVPDKDGVHAVPSDSYQVFKEKVVRSIGIVLSAFTLRIMKK